MCVCAGGYVEAVIGQHGQLNFENSNWYVDAASDFSESEWIIVNHSKCKAFTQWYQIVPSNFQRIYDLYIYIYDVF